MLIVIWTVGLLLLVLWSATVWDAHAGWKLLIAMPWDQALAQWKALELPPWLEPVLGLGWERWLDALEPVLAWLAPLVQSSAGWFSGVVVGLLWLTWALGALLLLAVTGACAAGMGWWRGRRREA